MQKIIVSVWHGSLKQSFSKFPLFVEFFAASLINQRIWIPTNCTEPGDLQSHPVAQAFHLFEPPRWCQSFLCTLDPRSCHQLFDSTAAAGLGWDDWRGWGGGALAVAQGGEGLPQVAEEVDEGEEEEVGDVEGEVGGGGAPPPLPAPVPVPPVL